MLAALRFCVIFLLGFSGALEGIKVKLYEVTDCREPSGQGKLTANIRDNGNVDSSLDLPFDIKDGSTFILKAHEFNHNTNEWTYNKEVEEGEVCSYMKQYLPKAWDKARSASDPAITEECQIMKGSYQWTDFGLNEDDVIVPLIFEGKRYKLDVTVFNEDEEPALCVGVDVEA